MNRIRELRIAQGWTQSQLGARIGAVKTTISGYENEDHQPDVPTIHALCDLFGCTADYLLCRSETPIPVITDRQAQLLAAYDAAEPRDREYIDHLLRMDSSDSKKEKAV